MELTNANITLSNPRLPELEAVYIEALADTGAVHLCISARIQAQLQLEETDRKEVTLADGSHRQVPYVGPIELHYKNRVRRFGDGRPAIIGRNSHGGYGSSGSPRNARSNH